MNHEICVKKRAQVKIVRYSAIILPPKLISNEFKQFSRHPIQIFGAGTHDPTQD